MQRLSKFLSGAGVASRRHAEEIIRLGRVVVNGDVQTLPQFLVSSADRISIDGCLLKPEPKVYYLLNKPKGYVCSTRPPQRYRSVLDLFGDASQRLFTVGRLDADTTGLLIVTNDGDFANSVIHPRHQVQKEYLVKTYEEISADHLKILSAGTRVEGAFVKPLRVCKIRQGTMRLTVREGRKREVRCMCRVAGLHVRALQRIRLGNLRLGNLPIGAIRVLTEREYRSIFE